LKFANFSLVVLYKSPNHH